MKKKTKKHKKLYQPCGEVIEEISKNDKCWKEKIYLFFYRLYYRIISFPGNIKRDIYFFFQRGLRGYADCDTWGFDHYLSEVISGGVKNLKAICHSLPTWKEGKTELESKNEWDCILNTIVNTFDIAKDISKTDVIYLPTATWSDKEYMRCKQMAKESRYIIRVLSKKEAEEFEKGFKYFQKFFFSLWD